MAKLTGYLLPWTTAKSAAHGRYRQPAPPLFLVGDSVFLSAFEAEQSFLSRREAGAELADLVLTFLFVAVPFVLFIAGPRIAAGSGGGFKVWLARFAVYVFLLFTGRQLAFATWL